MSQISIYEGEDYRSFESSDLPIKIGTDLNADIRILGPLSIGVVLLLDSLDGRPFVQVVNEKIEVLINGQLLSGNHRINNEDRIDVADKSITFELSSDNELTLKVTSNEDSLQPTQFQKKTAGTTIFGSRIFKYSAVALILGLTYFLFYLFTSKAVEINTMPADAKVSVSGGFFPHLKISGRFLLRPGEYRADYSRSGYFPNSLDIEINDESSQVIDIKLKKLPGIITFTTRPDVDFELYLEGKRSTPSICEDVEISLEECRQNWLALGPILAAGTRDVELRFEKYFPIKEQLVINGMGEEQEFIFDLEPAWADVQIDTKPSGAEIFIDSKNVGLTPLDLDLIEGQHVLGIKKNGYKDFSTEIAVKARENIVLEPFNLNRLDSKLSVVSYPKGASVNINSIYQGLSPVIVELPPLKPHVVEVSKPGYQTQTEEIILPTREEMQANGAKDFLQIETNLKPIKGFIRIIGTEGASILADGKQIAQIPSTIELLAKAQTLIVQKEGYVTQEINIQPTPGYEQNLNIRLLTPEEAVLAAMPEYIQTSLGLQMRLVSPGTFVMGTPRGDQGRRQGETERLIKITRPFYVGVREIINKEFRQFKPRHTSGAETFRELSNGLHPAVMLAWEEAVDFCQQLSSKESLEPAYEKINGQYQLIQPVTNGYRLLTEAEWEWVARFNGGAGKQRYPWGESMPVKPESGNYADESVEGLDLVANTLSNYWDGYPVTSPAQKFNPSALGIYDLGGNVAEWVNDYYSVYSTNLKQAELDPLGPDEGTARVIRGSSWRDSSISKLRFAYRSEYGTLGRLDVGFRIARYTDTSNIDE